MGIAFEFPSENVGFLFYAGCAGGKECVSVGQVMLISISWGIFVSCIFFLKFSKRKIRMFFKTNVLQNVFYRGGRMPSFPDRLFHPIDKKYVKGEQRKCFSGRPYLVG